jgi:hypothetical protein
MKSRVLRDAAAALRRREEALRGRFLTPVWGATSWEPHNVDYVAAYISLLHSEAEHTLENIVRMLLQNAALKSRYYKPDAVLVNCCLYFRGEMHSRLGALDLIPKKADLVSDKVQLLKAWSTLGAEKYFQLLLARNHGAGMQYVESLFHPLGIVVFEKTFRRLSSSGVQPVLDLGGATTTMVTEFVLLRGAAVHAGTAEFRDSIRTDSPPAIATRGAGVVRFIDELSVALARRVW